MQWLRGFGLVVWLLPVTVAAHDPRDDLVQYETTYRFSVLEQRLVRAIADHNMGLVSRASASRGASARGVTIPGNAVLGIFRNDYAVRLLAASTAAGIEAPLRIYLTENVDGSATLRYRSPSAVFAPSANTELEGLARELDSVFTRIVADAVGR